MSKADRGFASMSKERQREIAALGGKAAHAHGTAHEWTIEEARIAGKKGGDNSAASRRARRQATQATPDSNVAVAN